MEDYYKLQNKKLHILFNNFKILQWLLWLSLNRKLFKKMVIGKRKMAFCVNI